jgi:hypothetical protein
LSLVEIILGNSNNASGISEYDIAFREEGSGISLMLILVASMAFLNALEIYSVSFDGKERD